MTGIGAGGRAVPTLLSIAFPYAALGPQAVGGAEVICTEMELALQGLGFRSVVVARAGSTVAGVLYGTEFPEGTITDEVRSVVEQRQQALIDRACREQPVRLVHMHGLDFARYRIPEGVPVVVTLHLPPEWYPESIWQLPERYSFVCVSESQRERCPAAARGRVRVIANGVALPDAATLRSGGRYALMLARICPEKNLHAGLDAARLAGMPVVLGGETFAYEEHQRYFAEEIATRLTASGTDHEMRGDRAVESAGARFAGPVRGAEKARLLRRAACLLLPTLAPETSSLVAMEAMAAGVPVVGMRVGAVPEIVDDGRTGFLVAPGPEAVEQMAAALQQIGTLDRAACRREAEARFSLDRMVVAYGELYRELLASAVAPAEFEAREALQAVAIDTGEALYATQQEWEQMWAADPAATPFQHPAWLLPWWRQFGPDGRLAAVAVRGVTSGRLLGLLPSYLYRAPGEPSASLLLAGAGTSDYLGGVFAGEEVATLAVTYALRSGEWTAISWPQMPRGASLLRAGEAAGVQVRVAEPCSLVPTAKALPAKLATNLGRYRRLAEAAGAVRCEMAASPEEALGFFEDLVRFHTARWQRRGEEGVLQDARVLAHHREALPLLLQAGVLRMFRLLIGNEVAGVLYAMADAPQRLERRLYLYLIGFAEAWAAASPGGLLVQAAFEQARREGAVCLDLLRGGEAYKRHWGAASEPTAELSARRGEG